MSKKNLIKSTSIIGGATVASRVLGFVRDVLFAKFFGTNMFAQAFVVAFRLPNMLRDMVGEGATNAAIVPVLTEYKHIKSDEEYWDAARAILNLMITALIVITAIGVLFAPLLIRLIAPGFLQDPKKYQMTVTLTRMMFPYILLLGLVAYAKGVLNSLNYFTTPAFSPVILNITLIFSLFVLCPVLGIKGLVSGVILGGIGEILIQIKPLKARGFTIKGVFNLVHPVIKRVGKLLLPRALGSAVYQLSIFVDTILASLAWVVGAGGVAGLYYANRIVHLPLAVFGISLATAVLPKMSKEIAVNNKEEFKKTISFSLRTVFTVMIPAIAGLLVLSRSIITILFQRGAFTEYSTGITTKALFFYSFGLFAYAGIKILVSAYYSMGDTKTPVKTAAFSLLINIVLNLILMWPLKIGGLALATSIAAITNFIILYVLLIRKIGDIETKRTVLSFLKITMAAIVMGICTYFLKEYLLKDAEGVSAAIRLVLTILSSLGVYLLFGWIMGVEGIRKGLEHLFSRVHRA